MRLPNPSFPHTASPHLFKNKNQCHTGKDLADVTYVKTSPVEETAAEKLFPALMQEAKKCSLSFLFSFLVSSNTSSSVKDESERGTKVGTKLFCDFPFPNCPSLPRLYNQLTLINESVFYLPPGIHLPIVGKSQRVVISSADTENGGFKLHFIRCVSAENFEGKSDLAKIVDTPSENLTRKGKSQRVRISTWNRNNFIRLLI